MFLKKYKKLIKLKEFIVLKLNDFKINVRNDTIQVDKLLFIRLDSLKTIRLM